MGLPLNIEPYRKSIQHGQLGERGLNVQLFKYLSTNGLSIFQEIEVSESEGEDEWIAVDNNDDSLIDIECMSEELYHPTDCEDGNDTITTESELSDDSEDLNSSEDEDESEDDELLQIIIIRDSFNGTLFDHGYPDFIIIDIFDYI